MISGCRPRFGVAAHKTVYVTSVSILGQFMGRAFSGCHDFIPDATIHPLKPASSFQLHLSSNAERSYFIPGLPAGDVKVQHVEGH